MSLPRFLGAVLLLSPSLAAPLGAQLLNGGFERGASLTAFPAAFGVWGVDLVSFVGAEAGITPFEGAQMGRFDATTLGTGAVGDVADTWNLADLSPWAALVSSGHGHLRVVARFNRVPDGPCVDTRFGIQLQAHDGGPETYPTQWPDPLADSDVGDLYSDGDPATWETATAELDLPPATTFASVILLAVEDVCDTGVPPFDGHYADGVELFVDAWIDVGQGSGSGAPSLKATGELSGGAAGELRLEGAPPASPALLVTALGPTSPLPLLGGTLAAFPISSVAARPTDVAGEASLGYRVPGGIAPGLLVTCQFVVVDPVAPTGVAFSNAVEGQTH